MKVSPKTDEFWFVRVQYWPEDKERIILVKFYYVWQDGEMQFVPVFDAGMGDPVWVSSCYKFELIERVNVR